jgi:hypothetical protein
MSDKICPLMSKYDSEKAVPNWIFCQKGDCGIWSWGQCGLITWSNSK